MAAKGFECVLKIDTVTVGIARDFDPTYSAEEQDITTRNDSHWYNWQGGLLSWVADIETLWTPTDAALQALYAAWVADTTIVVLWTDADGYGRQGDAGILEFHPGPQNLSDAVMCSISLKGRGAVTVVTSAS